MVTQMSKIKSIIVSSKSLETVHCWRCSSASVGVAAALISMCTILISKPQTIQNSTRKRVQCDEYDAKHNDHDKMTAHMQRYSMLAPLLSRKIENRKRCYSHAVHTFM